MLKIKVLGTPPGVAARRQNEQGKVQCNTEGQQKTPRSRAPPAPPPRRYRGQEPPR